MPLYITKDGEYFVPQVSKITAEPITPDIPTDGQTPTPTPVQEIEQSDSPEVELFIMTHCPYGTQAEKGLIPVIEAMKDADIKIRFVHYFMHGDEEEQETYRQLCIREEQPEKYIDYLKCFLDKGESQACMAKVSVDAGKLNTCMSESGKAKAVVCETGLRTEIGKITNTSPSLIRSPRLRSLAQ